MRAPTSYAFSDQPLQFRRVPSERFRSFIQELISIDEELDEGLGQLHASIRAVEVVNRFIGAEPQFRMLGVSVVLKRLLSDLSDVAAGAKPKTFFDRGPEASKAGRPTGLSSDTSRAGLIDALNALINAGLTIKEATKKLAGMLDEQGFKIKGHAVPARQLKQWREQVGDSSPKQVDEFLRLLNEFTPPQATGLSPLENAQTLAANTVRLVRRHNSN